ALAAGNDLDTPQNASRQRALAEAIADGSLPAEVVNQACARMLALVDKAKAAAGPVVPFDAAEHHAHARAMAAASIVLLRNEGGLLPLQPAALRRILVVGDGAVNPVIQGSGSATTLPTARDIPLDEIARQAGAGVIVQHLPGHGDTPEETAARTAEAAKAAEGADAVLVFVTTDAAEDGEGADRRTLALARGHDALIEALAAASGKVVVVLANPDAVVMPWAGKVAAIVETFFAGQAMGGALADILFGAVNPSGKLTVSFPARIEDTPAYLSYPGEAGVHEYAEGIFVGYRYYDKRAIAPLFPFGFGLSYTSFAYSDLEVATPALAEGEDLRIAFTLANTGPVAGAEVAQLYLGFPESRVQRPLRELKGFAKRMLAPGETTRVELAVPARDLCFFDAEAGRWRLEEGAIAIELGASSRDIRLAGAARAQPARPHYPPLAIDSQPTKVLANPVARAHFERFLAEKLGLSPDQAARMLAY
ncbi:MAG TPA: glycoside hydrolase family 3 C-terminal domain-containing protein, partial [Novosphingobium sp.]|nr:glycoside hydrolase family 3 C-terminal domain-containing protein [Novosphingobium sp.]